MLLFIWSGGTAVMSAMIKSKKRWWIGGFGLLVALIALTVSLLTVRLESVDEISKPIFGERVTEAAGQAREHLANRFKGIESPQPQKKPLGLTELVQTPGPGFGFAGLVPGVLGYVRREDVRLAATTAVIAVTAIAWHSLLVAITLTMMLVLMGVVVRGMASHSSAWRPARN